MLRAGVGVSISHNPRTAALEACAAAMTQAGIAQATGAIFFATTAHGGAFPLILRTVGEQTKTREVVGCSTTGVIASETEVENGPALSVLVFGGDEIHAKRIFVPSLRGRAREVASELAAAAKPALGRTNLLCVLADTYNMNADPFLAALEAELPGVVIVGGGASEDGSIGETFQFCGDTVSSNSVSAMLLSGDFDLNIGASLACTQIGPMHRVTQVRDNIVITLDDRPAYEVFEEAAGPLTEDLRRALAFVFLGIPLDENPPPRLERGRFIVRNIVGASEEHGVIAVAHYPKVGDAVGLVLRNAERARDDLKATLEQMSARATRPASFGLYFDCVSRGSGLYNIPGHDAAYIRQYLGEVPVAGFFTGFEIGPLGDATGLLQYSGVLALISEKKTLTS
ncbi:MAG TPA: FIST N-terminal domain-containing protein [Candidatus Binataceae bacterium]|nr:FIST N-terminal domain-containing protein [Candidatus Binataceae bacterium]